MAEISEDIIERARDLLGRLSEDGAATKYGADVLKSLYTDEDVLALVVEELDQACDDSQVALDILKLQAREIEALRAQVRAYAAGVAEIRIENAALRARLEPSEEG
jgi:hypothetical protein